MRKLPKPNPNAQVFDIRLVIRLREFVHFQQLPRLFIPFFLRILPVVRLSGSLSLELLTLGLICAFHLYFDLPLYASYTGNPRHKFRNAV